MSDLLALSRAAVASPLWRWLPGMAFAIPVDDDMCASCLRYPGAGMLGENGMPISRNLSNALPDLEDPATLGAIEHGLLAPAGIIVERWYTDNSYGAWSMDYTVKRARKANGPADLIEIRAMLSEALVDGLGVRP